MVKSIYQVGRREVFFFFKDIQLQDSHWLQSIPAIWLSVLWIGPLSSIVLHLSGQIFSFRSSRSAEQILQLFIPDTYQCFVKGCAILNSHYCPISLLLTFSSLQFLSCLASRVIRFQQSLYYSQCKRVKKYNPNSNNF